MVTMIHKYKTIYHNILYFISIILQTCGLTTYCPFVADRISRECSNSLVMDSIVLAGLGNGEVDNADSVVEG